MNCRSNAARMLSLHAQACVAGHSRQSHRGPSAPQKSTRGFYRSEWTGKGPLTQEQLRRETNVLASSSPGVEPGGQVDGGDRTERPQRDPPGETTSCTKVPKVFDGTGKSPGKWCANPGGPRESVDTDPTHNTHD